MAFQISEIVSESDFQKLVEIEFDSFENPPNALRVLFYPTLETAPDARKTAINQARERILQSHRTTKGSRWIKAVDPETNRIIGGALWIFFESNPYSSNPFPECTWWPEGEGKEFTTIWYHEFRKSRVQNMSRSHSYLNLCFVHPDFRRRGAGGQLLDWGVKRTDELGMVAYIDATSEGKGLYESFGFVARSGIVIDFSKTNPGELWKKLEGECLPYFFWPMFRGIGGKPFEGAGHTDSDAKDRGGRGGE